MDSSRSGQAVCKMSVQELVLSESQETTIYYWGHVKKTHASLELKMEEYNKQ